MRDKRLISRVRELAGRYSAAKPEIALLAAACATMLPPCLSFPRKPPSRSGPPMSKRASCRPPSRCAACFRVLPTMRRHGHAPGPSLAGNDCLRRLVRSPRYAFVGAGLSRLSLGRQANVERGTIEQPALEFEARRSLPASRGHHGHLPRNSRQARALSDYFAQHGCFWRQAIPRKGAMLPTNPTQESGDTRSADAPA